MKFSRTIKYSAIALIIAAAVIGIALSMGGDEPAATSSHNQEGGIPVLAYHFLNDHGVAERGLRAVGTVLLNLPLLTTRDAWAISRSNFEKQLKYLKENGYRTITMEELESYLREEKELDEKCVAITFDDGDRSVYRYAYPLLRKYGMCATLFMITSKAGMKWNDLEICSWDELKEMEESGVMEIHSHTHDLHYKVIRGDSPHPLFELSRSDAGMEEIERIANDLRRSRLAIKFNLGRESGFLAWPYGFSSPLGDSLATTSGFDVILTLKRGTNYPGDSVLRVKRFTITSRTSMGELREMVGGRGKH